MKQIYTSDDLFQINVIKQFLEGHDIPSFVHGEHLRGAYGGLNFSRPRLMVLEDDFERAYLLIKEQEGG